MGGFWRSRVALGRRCILIVSHLLLLDQKIKLIVKGEFADRFFGFVVHRSNSEHLVSRLGRKRILGESVNNLVNSCV